MKRIVQPEMLDSLLPGDPRAIRSRRDLHRVNAWMANHTIMAKALQNNLSRSASRQITELGAGDGNSSAPRCPKNLPKPPGYEGHTA